MKANVDSTVSLGALALFHGLGMSRSDDYESTFLTKVTDDHGELRAKVNLRLRLCIVTQRQKRLA